jgi:peptidoglycan/LPS O-acetylase OafA/YrhL
LSYDTFHANKRITEVDGIRAIAILFVIAGHMGDAALHWLTGIGVPLFFVNSGFLITLILLRDEAKNGRVDFRRFFVTRAWRLLPIYYVALALFMAFVVLGFAQNAGNWWARLPFFVGLMNEFAIGGTFSHTWTLTVQEKFYVVWPLIAFGVSFLRARRLVLGLILMVVLLGVWALTPSSMLLPYLPLVAGCLLAVIIHNRKTFGIVAGLAKPWVFFPALLVAGAVHVHHDHAGLVSLPFAFAALLVMPGVLLGPAMIRGVLASRPLVFVGRRVYSIYLFHPLVISAVDLVVPADGPIGMAILRYVLVVVGAVVFASVTYMVIELPCIEVGRNVVARRAWIGPLSRPRVRRRHRTGHGSFTP